MAAETTTERKVSEIRGIMCDLSPWKLEAFKAFLDLMLRRGSAPADDEMREIFALIDSGCRKKDLSELVDYLGSL